MTDNNFLTIYKATQVVTIENFIKVYSLTNQNIFFYNFDFKINENSLEYSEINKVFTHLMSFEFILILKNRVENINITNFF